MLIWQIYSLEIPSCSTETFNSKNCVLYLVSRVYIYAHVYRTDVALWKFYCVLLRNKINYFVSCFELEISCKSMMSLQHCTPSFRPLLHTVRIVVSLNSCSLSRYVICDSSELKVGWSLCTKILQPDSVLVDTFVAGKVEKKQSCSCARQDGMWRNGGYISTHS